MVSHKRIEPLQVVIDYSGNKMNDQNVQIGSWHIAIGNLIYSDCPLQAAYFNRKVYLLMILLVKKIRC